MKVSCEMDLAEELANCKAENLRLSEEKNNIVRDFNTRMKDQIKEVRLLKQVNQRLQTELDDLRDLCCYLDDDRIKCRNLAKEWQDFGRHISSTLHAKENCYQQQVNSLSSKQETILTENNNLKKLCHQLENHTSSVNATPREYVCIRCSQRICLKRDLKGDARPKSNNFPTAAEKPGINAENSLISQNGSISQDSYHEGSKGTTYPKGRRKKVSFIEPDEVQDSENEVKHEPLDINSNARKENRGILRNGMRKNQLNSHGSTSSNDSTSSAQEIDRAMKVLEIHSKLEERGQGKRHETLKGKEVAVLKEMCNAVWRKLSNDNYQSQSKATNDGISNGIDDDIVYEDLL